MQFSGKIGQIIGWHLGIAPPPVLEILDLPLGFMPRERIFIQLIRNSKHFGENKNVLATINYSEDILSFQNEIIFQGLDIWKICRKINVIFMKCQNK